MDKKYIIIILIIAIIAVTGAYFLFNDNQGMITNEHTTIVLSKSAYMEVPKNPNATSKADKKGIFYYKDKKDDINITSCSNLSASSSAKEMKKLKNSIATGSKKIKENDVVIYEKNGTYSAFIRNTQYNDTLLIQSTSKDLLLQCWNSVKYHDPTTKIKFNDTSSSSSDSGTGSIVSAVEKTESAVKTSSPSSTSTSSASSSSYSYSSSSGSKSYSDFGFGSSKSSGSSSGGSSGSGGGSYSEFGFE